MPKLSETAMHLQRVESRLEDVAEIMVWSSTRGVYNRIALECVEVAHGRIHNARMIVMEEIFRLERMRDNVS